MFDYAVEPPKPTGRPRYMTATISAFVHAAVVLFVIGLPILYASEVLPEPPDMLAFVIDAPPPPPPPPPPAPAPEAKKPEPAKPEAKEVPVEKAAPPPDANAAPTEAPTEVKPETGNEGKPVEAGFEKAMSTGAEGGVPGGIAGGVEGALTPPPPPPKPQGPVRVGGQVKAPSLTNRVNPAYPPAAQAAQVAGSVVIEATVSADGRVESVKVLNGNPLLQTAAVDAVKQWRYQPLMLNGVPVPFILTVTVNFSLPR
jgi:periplasmic protein TonB